MKKGIFLTLVLGATLSQGAQAATEAEIIGESKDGKFIYFADPERLNKLSGGVDTPRKDFPTNPESMGKLCVSLITNSLKAPSTAKFQYPVFVSKHPNGVRVMGKVDAQNSYGAMLRNTFYCNFVASGADKMNVYYDSF